MTQDDVPIRQAATIMLLRDSDAGVQTYMLRRNRRTVFGPGMHVFPGGALDPQDSDPEILARCDGLSPDLARRILGGVEDGLALWVSALRECFEEAGVLIATDAEGRQPSITAELRAARDALNAGERSLLDICRAFDLRLPVDRLCYYSHWITPRGEPRRYSTRFFACSVDAGQAATHDGSETVAGEWVTPARAVERNEAGEFPMMPPTLVQMRFLCAYDTVEQVMDEIRGMAKVPTVEGEKIEFDEQGNIERVVMRSYFS